MAQAERDQRQDERATTRGRGSKEAEVSPLGAPGSPSGPNEVDDGDGGARIPPERPIPPGEDQPGLLGGGGIEGSGNVEPAGYVPEAETYPPLRDEREDAPARMDKRAERDKAADEDRAERLDAAAAGPRTKDRIGDALEQKKTLIAASEKASQERDERIEADRERIREGGGAQRK